MSEKETGIPCFECGERSGMDCPGRRTDEATRCEACMGEFMRQLDEAETIMENDSDILKRLSQSQSSQSTAQGSSVDSV